MDKTVELDVGTYGNTLAAKTLAKLVSNEPNGYKLAGKVGRILARLSFSLKELNKVESKTRQMLGLMLYKKSKLACNDLPDEIKTYTENVISTIYKTWSNNNK